MIPKTFGDWPFPAFILTLRLWTFGGSNAEAESPSAIQAPLDCQEGFYGTIEARITSITDQGLLCRVHSVHPWRGSLARFPERMQDHDIVVSFASTGHDPGTHRPGIRELTAGQSLHLSVADRDGQMTLLALSRAQIGMSGKPKEFYFAEPSPHPVAYLSEEQETVVCENGRIRVRPSEYGIIWFDVYHPKEHRWYLQKNNLNLMVEVGQTWNNTEGDRVVSTVEIMANDADQVCARYHYSFPNGAKLHLDLTVPSGEAAIKCEVHADRDSPPLTGFQWHITDGQSEAVSRLQFDSYNFQASDFPRPLPGGRLTLQKVQRYFKLSHLVFRFSGDETPAPDPNNPPWLERVLGLQQEVTWGRSMRDSDSFAFELRDQPWQPDWKVPRTIPWFEGLHFVRIPFLEGDRLDSGSDSGTSDVSRCARNNNELPRWRYAVRES